jgi:hypothetical protein
MPRSVLALGGTALVVVVVAAVALSFYGNRAGVGGTASPSPSPTPSPTATVSPPSPSPTPEGFLPEGPHLLWNQGGLSMTVTIPAPGWWGEPGGGALAKNDNPDPFGAGMITFVGDLYVFGDPCRWATTRPDTPATTVDEFVAAMSAQASRDATEPVDVTVDGYAGKSITVHVPDDANFAECDGATFGSWGMPGSDLSPFRYHQAPGQIDKLWVLDVDGELVVIDAAYYERTSQAVIDELEAIAGSASFSK